MLSGFGLVCAADARARSHHDAALFDDDAVPSFVDRRTASDEPFGHRGQQDPSVARSSPPIFLSLPPPTRPFLCFFSTKKRRVRARGSADLPHFAPSDPERSAGMSSSVSGPPPPRPRGAAAEAQRGGAIREELERWGEESLLSFIMVEFVDKQVDELKKLWSNKRQLAFQGLNLAMIVLSALMIWKSLMVVTKSESPVVVVLR